MNHIEDKSSYELDVHRGQYPYNVIVYMTHRQASWITAVLVVLMSFVFVAGYFWGQYRAATMYEDAAVTSKGEAPFQYQGYYAQLVSFGTLYSAQLFVQRLHQKNMAAKIVERNSETAQGKKVIWYQVITEKYENKDDLIAFIEKIEKYEQLNDIHIIAC